MVQHDPSLNPPSVGLEIVTPGVAGAIRDGGRPGRAHLGSSRGGAVDLDALDLVNRLLGNPAGAAALETSGGLIIRLIQAAVVAVSGSQADVHVAGGPPLGWGTPTALPAGAVVRIGRLMDGSRTYLGVRGGLVDRNGSLVTFGPDPGRALSSVSAVPRSDEDAVVIWPGPRLDWFSDSAPDLLVATSWEVRPDSDRVGVRLTGPPLERCRHDELPSEGLVEGAIQVPPDGQPIVMLADHPTTGGYPVIAVVDPLQIGRIAQRRTGGRVRFRWTSTPSRR
jgi:allophanate hydrolase subunit 2